MDGVAKAQGGDDVDTHAAEGEEEIDALGGFGLALESCAQLLCLVDAERLGIPDSGLGKGGVQDVLALLGLGMGEEAEAGPVLVEALVQGGLLVPAVPVVVDVVVGLWIGKVELDRKRVSVCAAQ